MGLSQDAHAAVDRYGQDVGHAVDRITGLRRDVEALAHRLVPGGPLGETTDPDLTRARQRLAFAAARVAAAASALASSTEPCRDYLDRAFPG